jgi:hypothetical protein
MRTLTKIVIGLLALALVLAAAGALAWRAGLLDPVLARLDRLPGVDVSRSDPEGSAYRDRDRRGPDDLFPIGRGLARRAFSPWLRFGRFSLLGGLALLGAVTLLGGLVTLGLFALRALTRRGPPPPAAPPSTPIAPDTPPATS